MYVYKYICMYVYIYMYMYMYIYTSRNLYPLAIANTREQNYINLQMDNTLCSERASMLRTLIGPQVRG